MKQNQNFDHNHSQKVLSCHYNMDTNRVEARFEDGTTLSIDCISIEDECRDHAAVPCAAQICRPGNPLERRGSRGEPVELPACPAHRAGVSGGGAERTVSLHDKGILSGTVCFQGHDC